MTAALAYLTPTAVATRPSFSPGDRVRTPKGHGRVRTRFWLDRGYALPGQPAVGPGWRMVVDLDCGGRAGFGEGELSPEPAEAVLVPLRLSGPATRQPDMVITFSPADNEPRRPAYGLIALLVGVVALLAAGFILPHFPHFFG